jgi:hypothetical protein
VTTAGAAAADHSGLEVDVSPDGTLAACPGSTLQFTAAVDPPGSYTYQWTRDGTPIPGATGPVLSVSENDVNAHSFNCQVTTGDCTVGDPAPTTGAWTTGNALVHYDANFSPVSTLEESCGDGDAFIEPGELWQVTARLANGSTCATAHNVRADLTVSSGSPLAADVCTGTGYYGTVGPGGTALHTYDFEIDQGAVCVDDVDFDLSSIWWTGGGPADTEPSAFQVQVGSGTPPAEQNAVQATDPLSATNGLGTSLLLPALTLPKPVGTALLDYTLGCDIGPFTSIYTTPFTNLSGWTVSGPVSVDGGSPSNCNGFGGNNAFFNGDGTITRTVSTVGFQSIRIKGDFRGSAAYTQPTQCFQWWYSTNGGTNYTLYKSICGTSIPNGTWRCNETFDFPGAASNISNFRIRFQTTGGVSVRLDDVRVEGRKPACSVTADVRVELLSPTNNVFTIKAEGVADPSKPIDVTSTYNHAQGGPGTWKLRIREFAGGTASMTAGALSVAESSNFECDESAACSCPAGAASEVSDDPLHLLRLARNGSAVDLRFEDLPAASYNVYVTTSVAGSLLDLTGGDGRKSCGVATTSVPGGMRLVSGYDVEAGITTPSSIHYVVVTADNGSPTEGPLGYSSTGSPRSATSYCAK